MYMQFASPCHGNGNQASEIVLDQAMNVRWQANGQEKGGLTLHSVWGKILFFCTGC